MQGPLVQVTRKNVEFKFSEEHIMAMEKLKMLAQSSSAIKAIDYQSDCEVMLAVDSSWMAVVTARRRWEKISIKIQIYYLE